jgi:hypothetical protein
MGVLCEWHGMNNLLEIAFKFKGALGDAGINSDATAQLVYLSNKTLSQAVSSKGVRTRLGKRYLGVCERLTNE